jgi:hypothetical protein
MTPDRIRRGSAIDLRLRVRQARSALCDMDALYDDLGDPALCARLKAAGLELAELEQCLGDIAEATRASLHRSLPPAAITPRPAPRS